jgi:hypothetical protein
MQVSSSRIKEQLVSSDPLAKYEQRGLEIEQQILEDAGDCYPSVKAAQMLGITEPMLETLRQQHKIVGLPISNGNYVYPSWLFVKTWFFRYRLIKGLNLVLSALPESDSWEQVAFLLDPLISVEMSTPLAGLQSGKIDLVVSIARSFGDHGAG